MSDPRIKKFGLAGFNKPKRTPNHKNKSHVVLAKEGAFIDIKAVQKSRVAQDVTKSKKKTTKRRNKKKS